MVKEKRKDFIRSKATRAGAELGPEADRTISVPSIAMYVDTAEWDARAESLGGNSYSLLAGFAAKLAEHLGRRRAGDGAVTLVIAINLRESLDDDRALAMAFANAAVDPTNVTRDLSEPRLGVLRVVLVGLDRNRHLAVDTSRHHHELTVRSHQLALRHVLIDGTDEHVFGVCAVDLG